jgi:tRNA-specific 2-thiouridylase
VAEAVEGTPERSWLYDWGYRNSLPLLLAGADRTKDQSYFLAGVKSESFRNVLFPIGHLMKNSTKPSMTGAHEINSRPEEEGDEASLDSNVVTVRSIASMASLPTASKKDSMGICFIGKRNFSDFINGYLPQTTKTGNFIDIDTGKIVGQYNTSSYFTVGQGAKISGLSRKWFITKVDKDYDTIYVCSDTHHPSLYSSELYVKLNEFNWICGEIPPPLIFENCLPVLCRIRHLQPLIPSDVIWDRDNQVLVVRFHGAVRAVTAGQMCVIYTAKGTVCLGGGPIWKNGATFLERNCPLPSVLHPSGNNDFSVGRTQISN